MIVLDTCSVLWDALSPDRLTKKAAHAIQEAEAKNELILCSISFWEIAMLLKLGRLKVDTPFEHLMDLILSSRNFRIRDLDPKIAHVSVNLPVEINKDPADRIISATTIVENASLVTADLNLRHSKSLRTLW